MTTATATHRRILITDHRDEATLRAAGYVPVQEATADSVGVFASGYSDITMRVDHAVTLDPDGNELAPAYTETVLVQSAQHQAEKACEAWLNSLPPLPVPAPATEPVPDEVSNQQLRLALIDSGIMPSAILASIAASTDETAREKALAAWEYANFFRRDHHLVSTLALQFGLSSAQVDALFRHAATLG